jgi:hypothetical protein
LLLAEYFDVLGDLSWVLELDEFFSYRVLLVLGNVDEFTKVAFAGVRRDRGRK